MKLCFVVASLATATIAHTGKAEQAGNRALADETYDYEWTEYITGDDHVDCGKGSLINGVGCTGSFCDDVRVSCRRGGEGAYSGNSTSYWTEEVSEETEPVICKEDYFATGFSCTGHFCDNVALQCTYDDRRRAGTECTWSDWVSEEGTGTISFFNTYVRGVECRDSYCDAKRVYLCPEVIIPLLTSSPSPAPSISTHAPSTFEDFIATDIAAQADSDGVCAYDWSKYAVVDHSEGADKGEAECGSPGALVAGAQCLSHFCDDVRLLCKTCECAYEETNSYWTEEFTSNSQPTICEDDYFTTGISCEENFCSVLKMQCTYNSGRTAGDCHWSDWVSEEGDGKISFSTGFVRGIECRGAYCDDKRFLLCPAIDENKMSCSTMRRTKGAVEVAPSAAPTTLLTEDGKVRDIQKGGGGGDPHFKTWTGKKFDYHGECDLVLINNPTFASGLGLRVHIRTTRKRYFSFIERIAVQIGADVLEFANDVDKWLLNGKRRHGNNPKIAGYEIRQLKNFISIRINDETKAKIDLSRRKNGMPYVVAEGGDTAVFDGSSGLLGDWRTGDMVGRDGVTVMTDPETYALEWQVRDNEPMLFKRARFPQFPTVCIPPKKMLGNRLGDTHMRKEAEQICEAWKEDKDDCIFDVMATRNVHSADEYPEEYAKETVVAVDVTVM